MGSADISQFVVTTADGTACEISTLKVRALFPHLPATFTGELFGKVTLAEQRLH